MLNEPRCCINENGRPRQLATHDFLAFFQYFLLLPFTTYLLHSSQHFVPSYHPPEDGILQTTHLRFEIQRSQNLERTTTVCSAGEKQDCSSGDRDSRVLAC
jgi:hypothetical protein